MDRTREFDSVVESTHVPQGRRRKAEGWLSAAGRKITDAERGVREMESSAEKKGSYDALTRFHSASSTVEECLRALSVAAEDAGRGDAEGDLQMGVAAVLRRKYASLSLRVSSALKRREEAGRREERAKKAAAEELEQAGREQARENSGDSRVSPGQQLLQREEAAQTMLVQEETTQLRLREMQSIEAHINELGKMVSEVSMHISMQGEKLQRIDEVFGLSRDKIKRGRREIVKTWENVAGTRRLILTVFGILFFILFAKMYLRG